MTTITHCQRMRDMLALLEVIRAHLAAYPVAAPVNVSADVFDGLVSVQLGETGLSAVAEGLLSWADTLTDCTAEAWRVPHGNSVHLLINGRAAAAVAVRIYGAVAYDPAIFPGLAPGDRQALPLDRLRGRWGGAAA
ncbi:hypothetical protein [Gandjariella thermophila]|uniref:Uncharacterized protein n=1 Tax=Gandjariella thermophila TaxID=1931992 RepID=A0A4D4JF33_9PSEU|nr:hypothetical protein [Gandjariella thermophila]GDY32996.1 hypothetical protein GTS_46290 [Gandjariella thermophila]